MISQEQFLKDLRELLSTDENIDMNTDLLDKELMSGVVADLNEIIFRNPGKTQLFFQLRDSRGANHVLLRSKTCGVDVRHTLIDYIEKADGLDYRIN